MGIKRRGSVTGFAKAPEDRTVGICNAIAIAGRGEGATRRWGREDTGSARREREREGGGRKAGGRMEIAMCTRGILQIREAFD